MSGTSTGGSGKPMEQSNSELSEAMGQLSVNSDKTSTSPKNLSDMPIDVVALIMERSAYKEQLKLRKVSKCLREFVDKQKPALTKLELQFFLHHIICYYNDKSVLYVAPRMVEHWMKRDVDRVILSDDYENIAFNDIAFTLKNRKLQLEFFATFFDNQYEHLKVRDILESLGHQLSVRNCGIAINCLSKYHQILPYLESGVLEKITVCYIPRGSARDKYKYLDAFKEIALLEQWKQAEELELLFLYEEFPMEYAKHFKRFHFYASMILSELFIHARNFILEHENVEFCSLSSGFPYMAELRRVVEIEASQSLSHYSTPDSEYYLEILFTYNRIQIEKKKKQSS